jgi:hypothetical protein
MVKRMRFLLENHVRLLKAARRKAKLSECSRSAADQGKHYAVVEESSLKPAIAFSNSSILRVNSSHASTSEVISSSNVASGLIGHG